MLPTKDELVLNQAVLPAFRESFESASDALMFSNGALAMVKYLRSAICIEHSSLTPYTMTTQAGKRKYVVNATIYVSTKGEI